MTGRGRSLELRLVVLTVLALALFGALAGHKSAEIARHEADELFDGQLVQLAHSLLSIGGDHDLTRNGRPAGGPRLQVHRYQPEVLFQLWSEGGSTLLLRSDNSPEGVIAPLPPVGFSNGTWRDRRFRFFRAREGSLEVLVGESDRARAEVADEVAEQTLLPYLSGVPLLALITIVVIRASLRPLRQFAAEVDERSGGRLDPLPAKPLPKELEPLAHGLDQLLARLRSTLDNERRFTADAAHELRTPLAAIRAQAESALLAPDPGETRAALHQVLAGSSRLEHLVTQLLTLARLEGGEQLPPPQRVDLGGLAELVCSEVGSAAVARGQDLSLTTPRGAQVRGWPHLLGALIRNVVDNALRYTPEHGTVAVTVTAAEGKVRLRVADDGPGVPAAELARLGDRFHRLHQRDGDGAGLGLSIVRRIAELHGARLSFARGEPSGLVVSLELGAEPD